MSSVRASRKTTGIRISTTGVLFMKADAATVPTKSAATTRVGWFVALVVSLLARFSRTPVRTSAPESTNIAAIVMGAELEKTRMASSGVVRPSSRNAAAPPAAVTSGG